MAADRTDRQTFRPGCLKTMSRSKIFSVSGIDGSGKTTIVTGLASSLRSQGDNVRVFWLRYNHYLTKPLLVMARLLGYTVFEQHGDCRVSYHEFYRSKVLSHAFIWLTWLDALLTTFFLVWIPVRLFDQIVICDRWVPDILIDLEIDTHICLQGDSWYNKMFWALVPAAARLMVVYRGYEDVVEARLEHHYDRNLGKRFELYNISAKHKNVTVIDNTADLERTLAQVKALL
jgi:hypothetical protein